MADPRTPMAAPAAVPPLPGDLDGLLAPLAAAFHRQGSQPGLAYGVVAGGSLVHAGGLGEQWLGGPVPGAGTVFRIASMTKSFTAAAVLLLRDEGALALDDPAGRYLPQVASMRLASPDSPAITIRNLLTMTAGFPTDDPWGDRQQGLPLDAFDQILAGGLSVSWAPGTRFEYSNLSYAVLGRVITAVTGMPYSDFVSSRLLTPLGMTATGYEPGGISPDQLARGYQRAGDAWAEQPLDGNGAFSPMGGLFSSVADLARWVSGMAGAFPPGEEADGGPHPLRRASRREMQLPQLGMPPRPAGRLPGGADSGCYGFGLFIEDDPAHGRIVQHSGGYPGYGSHMRWHPATGLGTIVLANGTYADAPGLGARMLDALLTASAALARADGAATGGTGPARLTVNGPAPSGPWPQTLTGQQAVTTLLGRWDDAAAAALFTENVAWDRALDRRRRDIAQVRERIGDFRADPSRPASFDTPAQCRWWLRGPHGAVEAKIKLSPEREPRVQYLTVAVPPAPDGPLSGVVSALVAMMNSALEWPAGVSTAPDVDLSLLLRQLRMAATWAGPVQLTGYTAGDGAASATAELAGVTGTLSLSVTIDPGTGVLLQAEVLVVR
ncbi:MAG TPA: serine hydrolase domain-containing protein [Streptosporangiaceae bacterium]